MSLSLLKQLFIHCLHRCRQDTCLYLLSILAIAAVSAFDAYVIYLVGSIKPSGTAPSILLPITIFLILLLPIRYSLNRTLLQASFSISFFIANSNFISFLGKQYLEQLRLSTGRVIVSVTDIPNQIGSLILQPFAQLVSSLLTILFMLVTLCKLVGLLSFLPIALLAIVYYSYIKYSHPRLRSNSEIIKESLASINNLIKNVKLNLSVFSLYDISDHYLKSFRNANKGNKSSLRSNSVILSSPKVILDGIVLVAILVISATADYSYPSNISSGAVVAILFAASRIMPAVQSVARLYSTITSAMPFLESCHLDYPSKSYQLLTNRGQDLYSQPSAVSLCIRDLVLPWGPDATLSEKIELFRFAQLTSGQPNIITGPSGLGKSTLLQVLSGLIEPQDGILTYTIDNNTLNRRGLIDFIPQHPSILIGSTLFNVTLSSALGNQKDSERYIRSLEKVNLKNLLSRSDLTNLSGGERYRLSIARAFYSCRPILLLDEPFAALDIHNVELIYASLLEFSKRNLLIIVSHSIPSFVRDSSTIYQIG